MWITEHAIDFYQKPDITVANPNGTTTTVWILADDITAKSRLLIKEVAVEKIKQQSFYK